jgi:hypothetical protein
LNYLPVVVGIATGGFISGLVTWRGMKPGNVSGDGEPITEASRRLALQVIAALFFVFTLACLIAAIVVGNARFLIGSAINFAIASSAFVYAGRPRGYWRYWAAIWRR